MKTIRLNKAPPIEQRPRCPQCNKPLAPYWVTESRSTKGSPNEWYERLEWKGDYHGYGAFDTMRCAVDYANAVVARARKNLGARAPY